MYIDLFVEGNFISSGGSLSAGRVYSNFSAALSECPRRAKNRQSSRISISDIERA